MNIINDDCLSAMAAMNENSIDTIITDPPYGLEFMGKGWDHGVPGVDYWAAALRVAKPGAMLLAFGGTRTFHRLACAIEDAGWEIRDCLMWLYGSGFPKSLDIAKALDQAGGVATEQQSQMLKAKREAAGLSREDLAAQVGCTPSSIRDWEEGRARKRGAPLEYIVPSSAYREKLATVLGYSQDERQVVGASCDRRGDGTVIGLGHSGVIATGGHTDLSKRWHGWSTALKPAWEPILLAMKSCDGTYVDNATKHGVAGLNIDGSRIDGCRWPANVILGEQAGELLGETSRFFYCAKASKKERGEDNNHPTVKPLELMRYLVRLTKTPTGGVVLDPFAGSGSTGLACEVEGRDCILIEQDAGYCDIMRRRAA